ncbi:MAG: cytochrome-c peroxidase [Saprospiraceae bacterium]|nr:cytochrome-c peroxidase [Saprospiraceae bacterium]
MQLSVNFLGLMVFCSILWTSCTVDDKDLWTGIVKPAHFPEPFFKVEVTKEGFELGRKLFYDPILSRDQTISCGGCHNQSSAFTHHGHDLSHGIDDLIGMRNSLPIQNLIWHNSFFWDGGVGHIDLISINPIENPVEMDLRFGQAIAKLNTDQNYREQFKSVYGSDSITGSLFLKSMTQFMSMLVSADSPYDQYLSGNSNALSAEEIEGMKIFESKCASCHSGVLQSDFAFRNNGLQEEPFIDDGRFLISQFEQDKGKFKVPSLRNVEYTYPYMHNGNKNSLEDVLHHYRFGIKKSSTLDSLLIKNGKLGIELTDEESSKIIQFLKTLSDPKFIRDKRFSEQ